MVTSNALSIGGKVFFGSLCAGTFGLGVWQTQRLVEKQELVEQRQKELSQPPLRVQSISEINDSFQQFLIEGKFLHDKEFLVGPRGPPPGALPDKPGTSAQGMSSAPQGYFVVTPLVYNNKNDETVLVNRGWVPRNYVIQDRRQQPRQGSVSSSSPLYEWERPTGTTLVTAVSAKPEQPKFLVAEHDFKTKPPKLYWFDRPAMQAVSALGGEKTVPLVTAVRPMGSAPSATTSFPVQPTAEKVGDFKVSPAVHAGYAFTWFGLSAAGMYMTRKLITKGRG